MSLNFTTDNSVQLTYSSFGFATPQLDNFTTSNQLLITSNQIINKINSDIGTVNTNLSTNYYTKTNTDTLLNAKENNLTFSSPLTRTTNTIGINLSSYSTTGNDTSYLLKTGGTMTGALINTSSTTSEFKAIQINHAARISHIPYTDGKIYLRAPVIIDNTADFLSFGARTGDFIIKLFGEDYGFGINSYTLRYNTALSASHKFYTGSTLTFTIGDTGNISTLGTITEAGTLLTSKYLQLTGGTLATGNITLTTGTFTGIHSGNGAALTALTYGNITGVPDFLLKSGGTLTGTLNGTTINATTALQEGGTNLTSKYLQLSGGSLTGTLNGTTIYLTGNIGVGTNNNIASLVVGNIDSDGSDGSIAFSKRQSVGVKRNFKMGMNGDYNFCIGDYGSANTANSWSANYFSIRYNEGNIGIGIQGSASYKLYVEGSTYFNGASTVVGTLTATTFSGSYTGNGSGLTNLPLSAYSTTGNDSSYVLKSGSTMTGNLTVNANLYLKNGAWHQSMDNVFRLWFDANGPTYYSCGNTTDNHIFYNSSYSTTFKIQNNGNVITSGNTLNIGGSIPYLQLKGQDYSLGVSGGIGNFSSSSIANDMILRTIAGTNLYLQAGVAGHALKIDSTNNVSIPNKLTISGEMNNAVNTWHKSSEGISRTYYDSNGTTFFQSGKISGTGNAFSFQNRESTATIFSIDAAAGAISIGSNLTNSFQLYVSAPYLTLPAYIQTLKLSSPYTYNQYLAIQPLGGTTGIGTDTAYSTATKLTIKGGSAGYSQPLVRIEQTNAWDGNYCLETVGYTNLNGIRINGGDTNSIYKTAATGDMGIQVNNGNILFGNNGGERMRIDASGNIGIGTNNCSTKLHIEHSSTSFFASTGGLYLYNPNNTANSVSVLGARIAGSSASKVGISLDVQNVGGWSIYMNGNDTERWLRFNNSWSASLTEYIQIRGTDGQMNINGNAYMGANVNINNGTLSFGNRVQDFLIYLYGTDYGFGINGGTLRYNSATSHKFYASSTNTATIDGSGNFSITGGATINGDVKGTKFMNKSGQLTAYNSNWNSTGLSGWFIGLNQFFSGNAGNAGTAYLTMTVCCETSSQYCWFGRIFVGGGGGTWGIVTDVKNPTSGSFEIFVTEHWDASGNNVLRFRTGTPAIITENLRYKIYG